MSSTKLAIAAIAEIQKSLLVVRAHADGGDVERALNENHKNFIRLGRVNRTILLEVGKEIEKIAEV